MSLNFRRILSPEAMRFELRASRVPSSEDLLEGFDPMGKKNVERIREEVIESNRSRSNSTFTPWSVCTRPSPDKRLVIIA